MANQKTIGAGIVEEIKNWNSAASYAFFKIMTPLAKVDEYERVARFGFVELYNELAEANNNNVDWIRFKGFERMVSELILLCDNTEFAMNKGNSKAQLRKIRDKLKLIRKAMHLFGSYKLINNRRVFVLDHKRYDKALDLVCELKTRLNEPLNMNDLIFKYSEKFDAKEYKEKLFEHLATH